MFEKTFAQVRGVLEGLSAALLWNIKERLPELEAHRDQVASSILMKPSSSTAEHHLRFADGFTGGGDAAGGLDEVAHATTDLGSDFQDLAGHCRAEDLGAPHGGQPHVGQNGDLGVGLRGDACHLGDGLDLEHGGHDGLTGEVAC